jgi:small-conductance mechanosensitive channel
MAGLQGFPLAPHLIAPVAIAAAVACAALALRAILLRRLGQSMGAAGLASWDAIARLARQLGFNLALTGIAQALIRTFVIVVGGLVLMGHLGIAITPLLTALGIGGVAVALALQDTLSNLIAGFHLLADTPVRVGDAVRLENGMEGTVEDIGWRSTRIRQSNDDLIIVPNAKLAQSILTNRYSTKASDRHLELHDLERTRH